MKKALVKKILIAAGIALFPSLLGGIQTAVLSAAPVFGTVLYWLFPFVMLLCWNLAGRWFETAFKNPAAAFFVSHSVGILSLGVYFWQEYFTAVKLNGLQLAAQAFTAPFTAITVTLNALFVSRFFPSADGTITVSNTALQVTGFVLMAVLFLIGYFSARGFEKDGANRK